MSGQLLIDIGNSALKWAVLHAGELGPVSYQPHAGDLDGEIAAASSSFAEPPAAVWIASVAGPEITARVAGRVQGCFHRAPVMLRAEVAAFGLVNGYTEPGLLGVDRWLAMVAAWTLVQGPCCVVDCGTAATIDAIDADGRHLGGFILPGIGTARRALLQHTRIPRVDDQDNPAEFGTDTAAAVAIGARLAVAGAVDHAMDALARRGPQPQLLLAGSEAGQVAARLAHPYRLMPQLVLEGMARYAGAGSLACAG